MKNKTILILFMIYLLTPLLVLAQVRRAILATDGILTIHTALGIATIIQLPEPIQSAIIGDQSGFKIESLDRAITIKPLRYGAKTNLYLLCQNRRFNLRVATKDQANADFIVYIDEPRNSPRVEWRNLLKRIELKGLTLQLDRIGRSKGNFLLLEGQIFGNARFTLRPEEFWILQNGESRPIDNLFISDLKIQKDRPTRFGLAIKEADLDRKVGLEFELRHNQKLSISLPEEALWH